MTTNAVHQSPLVPPLVRPNIAGVPRQSISKSYTTNPVSRSSGVKLRQPGTQTYTTNLSSKASVDASNYASRQGTQHTAQLTERSPTYALKSNSVKKISIDSEEDWDVIADHAAIEW